MSVQAEILKESSATAVPGTAGLKLRINLRDRQMIRKRHRSSSPSNSSDSSSTNGSNRPTRSQTVSAGGVKPSIPLKRNKKEHDDGQDDAITPPEDDPPSDGIYYNCVLYYESQLKSSYFNAVSASSRKKSPVQTQKVEVKKVRLNGTAKLRNIKFDSEETTEDGVHKKILTVDMNSDYTEDTKLEVPDPSGSPPASPVEKDETKFDNKSVDSKLKAATACAIKRLSRDVIQLTPSSHHIVISPYIPVQELERLIMEQMVMVIREKGATGQLEKKMEEADALVERYKRRTEALQKQVYLLISRKLETIIYTLTIG